MLAFASHRPLRWDKPFWLDLAQIATEVSSGASVLLVGVVALRRPKREERRTERLA